MPLLDVERGDGSRRWPSSVNRRMLRCMERNFGQSLEALEASARVPREQQIETQDVEPLREYIAPEDFDRIRLVASPESAGRLKPRG